MNLISYLLLTVTLLGIWRELQLVVVEVVVVVHTCSSLDNEHPASAVTYLSITKAGCSFFSHRSVAFSLPPGVSVDCSSVAEGRRWWWDLIMIDIV